MFQSLKSPQKMQRCLLYIFVRTLKKLRGVKANPPPPLLRLKFTLGVVILKVAGGVGIVAREQ